MINPKSKRFSTAWFEQEGAQTFARGFLQGFKLPPRQTVSEWADAERVLSRESSAEPGKWYTDRAEYQRGIMDAISDPTISEITIMASAQVGKTEMINNMVGFLVDKDPCPILLLQPTVEIAKAWSLDRLAPMVRDTPCLRGKIADVKENGTTVLHKVFPGGHITMAGANSAASLASRPIRVVLLDEVDRYPLSAGKEGDPVRLAIKRTATFWNRKIVKCSTPTIAGESRIDREFKLSDQRFYEVPCPHCGVFQRIVWSQVRWEHGSADTAYYLCPECGAAWNDVDRWKAISKGHWAATKPFHGHAGFSLWEGYSPWAKLADIVQNFLDAKGDPERLKTFVNTSLGEVWEDKGERIDETKLIDRREHYDAAPAEVVVITAGVDVQADRLEVDRIGWTANNQSYGLGKKVILGDPGALRTWNALDEILLTPIPHELNGEMTVSACCVDSGYLTQIVGRFCQERYSRRVWAVKGIAGEGRPIFKRAPGKLRQTNLDFFLIGTDSTKDAIYSRLKIEDPHAPGYCHFNQSYDEDHFKQLTAEELKISYVKGRRVRHYSLRPGRKRNEALDIFGYALAALEGLKLSGLDLFRRWEKMLAKAANTDGATKAETLLHEKPEIKPEQLPKPLIRSHRVQRRVIGMFG